MEKQKNNTATLLRFSHAEAKLQDLEANTQTLLEETQWQMHGAGFSDAVLDLGEQIQTQTQALQQTQDSARALLDRALERSSARDPKLSVLDAVRLHALISQAAAHQAQVTELVASLRDQDLINIEDTIDPFSQLVPFAI